MRRSSVTLCLLLLVLSGRATAGVGDGLADQGDRETQLGNLAHAIALYHQGLVLEPTSERCYLGLARARASSGDLREAVRVYSVALARLPTFTDAFLGRARLFARLGDLVQAASDIENFVTHLADTTDPGRTRRIGALTELASWYTQRGNAPAALATWRLLATLAPSTDASVSVRALELIAGPLDPVRSPAFRSRDRIAISRVRLAEDAPGRP